MKLELNPSDDERLLAVPFPFQQTYATPLDELERFVETILDPFEVQRASVWIEAIAFKPRDLIWFLRGAGINSNESDLYGSLVLAEDKREATALLECILGQWADFAFLPSPREFVVYADHDEFATVFTRNSEKLRSFRKHMKAAGFTEIQDWTWNGPRTPRKQERTKSNV